jgi:tetratricopeptide (TPR) repeat protein
MLLVPLIFLADISVQQKNYGEHHHLWTRVLSILRNALVLGRLGSLTHRQQFEMVHAIAEDRARVTRELAEALDADESWLANCLAAEAELALQKGDALKAETFFRRALSIREVELGKEHPDVAHCLFNLGKSASTPEDADTLYRRALQIYESSDDKEIGKRIADVLDYLARLYCSQRRFDEAIALEKRILAVQEKEFGESSSRIVDCLIRLSTILLSIEERKEAERIYARALKITETSVENGDIDWHVVNHIRWLVELADQLERRDDADSLCDQLLQVARRVAGDNSPEPMYFGLIVGRRFDKLKQYGRADKHFNQAIQAATDLENSPLLIAALESLASSLRNRGNIEDADRVERGIELALAASLQEDH